ncbi:putative dehydrogenase [Hydrogenispora ethanolica]|jgi:predicted dehydrogenase|uniref:Putative dehydrogenase n=1 Tax=Hydrogenispora ethanolica TaxID=1082276 RepID=A0A4V2QF78_HYDET|nr:Gfo/Idh/MocA family oxidoreductase [Hydrogenispora ethanolica]TCL70897.1 putative dehydrogenase [Hydrogenispora ethanolica]
MRTKVAVIGAGNWGTNLIKTLYPLGVLAAVADQSEAGRTNLKKVYPDLNVCSELGKLLDSDIQAVLIATPAPTHYRIAREALWAGKDVFIEKPMTLRMAEADELAAFAEKENQILMIGHLLLYQPAVQWLKAYLDSGLLGELSSLHQERLSLGRARETESVLWDLGVHDLAVMLYLTGTHPVVGRVSGQQRLRSGIEDDIYLHLMFDGNIQAHLHASWIWPVRRRQLTLTGAKGMLVYDEMAQTVTLHRNGIHKKDLSAWDEGTERVFQGEGAPLIREMEHFLQCVRDRKQPLSDGRSGAAVIKVLEEVSQKLRGESEYVLSIV